MSAPLTDEETERLLQEMMRQIVETRGATDAGQAAIRVAMAGLYAALLNLERSTPLAPLQPQQPD